jgi:hypothetical protein
MFVWLAESLLQDNLYCPRPVATALSTAPSLQSWRLSIYFGNSEHEPGGTGTDLCTIIRRLVKPPEGGNATGVHTLYNARYFVRFPRTGRLMHLKPAKIDFPLRRTCFVSFTTSSHYYYYTSSFFCVFFFFFILLFFYSFAVHNCRVNMEVRSSGQRIREREILATTVHCTMCSGSGTSAWLRSGNRNCLDTFLILFRAGG